MIYSKGRFYCTVLSFKLVDGYSIDSAVCTESECCFKLNFEGERYLEIRVERDCESAKAELNEIIEAFQPTEIYNMAEIQVNGLAGYQAAFRCQRCQRFEAWFNFGTENMALEIMICTEGSIRDVDVEKVIHSIDPKAN